MVTRVRIEAQGGSASEVEATLLLVAATLDSIYDWNAGRGEQVIERQVVEPEGPTAHFGRLILHPNVANDSGQVKFLEDNGVKVTKHYCSSDDAVAVGGVPYV